LYCTIFFGLFLPGNLAYPIDLLIFASAAGGDNFKHYLEGQKHMQRKLILFFVAMFLVLFSAGQSFLGVSRKISCQGHPVDDPDEPLT